MTVESIRIYARKARAGFMAKWAERRRIDPKYTAEFTPPEALVMIEFLLAKVDPASEKAEGAV